MVAGPLGALPPLVQACRPRQWPKNLLVFAAPLFAFRFEADVWLKAGGALVAFCLISSAIYLLNDCLDVAADRADRSGFSECACSPHRSSSARGGELELGDLEHACPSWGCAALRVDPGGLLLPAQADAAAGSLLHCLRVPASSDCRRGGWWVRLLSLVPAHSGPAGPVSGDREAQSRAADLGVITRKVLERYSLPLLLRLESLVATSAFMSYSLWAAGPALNGASTTWMLLTVPFALVGIFRYQLLSDPEEAERRRLLTPEHTSEKPEEILLGDRGIQLTLLAWVFTVVVVGLSHRADLLPEGGLQL